MGISHKSDNLFVRPKLLLRRYFLDKYHPTPPRILDCCQGSGKLWAILLKDYPVDTYWGLDKKPKKGRLMIDSERVLQSGKWAADIIDVDTYGSPWAHWLELLRTGTNPLTVFLTIGVMRTSPSSRMGGGGIMQTQVRDALGLGHLKHKVPNAIQGRLHDFIVSYCLRLAIRHGWRIVECQEAFPRKARYIGIRMEKKIIT